MSEENYIKCSGCGAIVPVPDELYPGPIKGEIPLDEPYYCDECDREDERDDPGEDYKSGPDYCSHCGKDIEDFSVMGCEYCDRRHPGFIGELC